jgi:membrane-associated phospholipid phosphatase
VAFLTRIARIGEGESAKSPSRSEIRACRNALSHACWCALAFAGLGLVTAQARDSWLGRLDDAVMSAIREGRSPSAIAAARLVSALAEPGSVVLPLGMATSFALRRAGWRAACAPSLSVAAGLVVRRRLSRAIARQRPPAELWLTEPEGFSLPSKHTSLAALTAGACTAALGVGVVGSHAAATLAAAGVGAGRVYLGVHWPSDVLAGWLFAAGWLRLAEAVFSASTRLQADRQRGQDPALSHGGVGYGSA